MSAAAAPIRASWQRFKQPPKPSPEANMLEVERYELFATPAYHFDLERRDFFKLLGGGVVLLLALDHSAAAQESGRGGRGQGLPQDISAWLHIGEDGIVTVFTGKDRKS